MRRSPFRTLVGVLAAPLLLAAFLSAPAGAAAPVETDTWGVSMYVDLANNRFDTGGWLADSLVTISIWSDATDLETSPVFSTAVLTDGSGWLSASFHPDGFDLDLVPGMGFAASGLASQWNPDSQAWEDTAVTKVLTDTWLQITSFDVEGDLIAGTGATPGYLQACAGGDWASIPGGCSSTDQPDTGLAVAPDGTWSWDLTAIGVDLVPAAMHVQAANQDGNGDMLASDGQEIPWPHLEVRVPNQVRALGFGWTDADVGLQVPVAVTWPGEGPTAYVADLVSNPWEGIVAELWLDDRSLEAGTVVELTGPRPPLLAGAGDVTRTVTVTPPAITDVDLSASMVSGTAAPWADLMVYPGEPEPPGGWVRRHVVADEGGAFSEQLSVPGDEWFETDVLTMTEAGSVSVHEYDEDFDVTVVARPNVVYEPVIWVMPEAGLADGQTVEVQGSGFPPGDVRFVLCDDTYTADGCDLGTIQGPVQSSGDGIQGWVSVRRYLWTANGAVDCGAYPGACRIGAFAFLGQEVISASALLTFAPPLEVGLWVSPSVTVSSASGRATASGTVTCSVPGPVQVSGELWQALGRKGIAYGWFSTTVWCDTPGEPVPWTAVLTPAGSPLLPFQKGVGELSVRAFMDHYDEHAEVSWEGVVTITVPKAPRPPKPPKS